MIIDIHTHTFPEHLAERALKKLGDAADSLPHTDGTKRALKESMKKNGVDISVMLPVATKTSQVEKLNDYAKDFTDPGKSEGLLSFGAMHCAYEDWKKELQRIRALGLKGIKLHHDYMGIYFTDERSIQIIREAFRLGLIVMIHAGNDPVSKETHYCTPKMISDVLGELGEGVLIASHYGGLMNVEESLAYLIGKDVYIDTSMGHYFYGMFKLKEVLNRHAPDRILFGTDSPWEDQGTGLGLLHSMSLSDSMIQKITEENPRRILGI